MQSRNKLVDQLVIQRLKEKADGIINSGELSARLRRTFGEQMGSYFFELIGIADQKNLHTEIDLEYIEDEA